MLNFNKDASLFLSTLDFGVNITICDTLITGIFDYKTIEEGMHQSRQPVITTSVANASLFKEGVELIITGHGSIDKVFKVRNAPEFNNDAQFITVALSDVITSTYDQILDKYIP